MGREEQLRSPNDQQNKWKHADSRVRGRECSRKYQRPGTFRSQREGLKCRAVGRGKFDPELFLPKKRTAGIKMEETKGKEF